MENMIDTLKKGGIGVLATDTIYGVVGAASLEKTVERIYTIKGRDESKPFIILISDQSDLAQFGITPTEIQMTTLATYWPGPTTIILPCPNESLTYLHRGKNSLAFRIPAPLHLRKLLKETGPLVAPSANTQHQPPARTVGEARDYFGDRVDFYEDAGVVTGTPSHIIEIREDGSEIRLR